jgi:hypothetical protein
MMMLVYLMQGWNWQLYWSRWWRFWQGSRQLALAVGSGGIAALSTYIAASIWVDSENPWLAVGSILQGFGTLLTLLLLVWHIMQQQKEGDPDKFDQFLADLTDADPLKRLIAVRQLTPLANHSRCHQSKRQQQLLEYFLLMLSQEKEPVIRKAVLDSIQQCQTNLNYRIWGRKAN